MRSPEGSHVALVKGNRQMGFQPAQTLPSTPEPPPLDLPPLPPPQLTSFLPVHRRPNLRLLLLQTINGVLLQQQLLLHRSSLSAVPLALRSSSTGSKPPVAVTVCVTAGEERKEGRRNRSLCFQLQAAKRDPTRRQWRRRVGGRAASVPEPRKSAEHCSATPEIRLPLF
ncbi:hypothetical protein D5086_026651 [Populus alba]|uniref:Uncharacterized protein n=1 Tax=Populus alba TaxID=43335 RepID=A0ACC4B2W3_POPAL